MWSCWWTLPASVPSHQREEGMPAVSPLRISPSYVCCVWVVWVVEMGVMVLKQPNACMSTCTNMDVSVLLCVCLFVCVCILRSVVYQDGFYGADIYVSIIYWYDIACYTTISVLSKIQTHPCHIRHWEGDINTCTKDTRNWSDFDKEKMSFGKNVFLDCVPHHALISNIKDNLQVMSEKYNCVNIRLQCVPSCWHLLTN